MTQSESSLVADYLAFDRRRRQARPFLQAFAGFSLLALLGGAVGDVPRGESLEAATLFVLPVAAVLTAHAWRWSRLQHRLAALRAGLRRAAS